MEPRKSLEPWLKDEVNYYEHQIHGVRQMLQMRCFLLADEMGLGKSLQALTVAACDIVVGKGDKILVVAPVTLKSNWLDEFEKFTRIPATVLGQIVDPKNPERLKAMTPKEREVQLEEWDQIAGPKALIANYEQILKHGPRLNKMNLHIVIFDEAHYLKNYKAKRTQACHGLRARRFFMLTGTPMLNQVNELWGILHMIDPQAFPKYWTFVKRYCVFGGYENKQIIGMKNEKELTTRLNSLMIRRLKKDVLDLPEVQYIEHKVDLLPGQKKIYDQVEEELEIPMVGLSDPSEIENALTRLLRLKQICGTTLPFNGKDESGKLDLAVELALEVLSSGHKIVVFTQFRSVQEAFLQRLEEYGKKNKDEDYDLWQLNGDVPQFDRQPIVKEWAAAEKPGALVCMLQVAGVGLNMTAASTAFFLDELYVPGLNQQAVDRLHRIGASETQPVQVHTFLCKGTIETRIKAILRTKSKLFGQVVNDGDFKAKLLAALRDKNAN